MGHLLLQPAPCFLSARALRWSPPPRQAGLQGEDGLLVHGAPVGGRHGLETALASKMPAPLLGRFGYRVSASEPVGTAAKPPGGTVLSVITIGGTYMGGTNGEGINVGE